MGIMERKRLQRDFRIDKDCPDYVKFQCPVCGLLTGKHGPHPPARGVWVDGKPPIDNGAK